MGCRIFQFRSFPVALPALDQWDGRRDCPKQGLPKPDLEQDFPATTWAKRARNCHLKGNLNVRAQPGNSGIGSAQSGAVFSGIEESQPGKKSLKTPLGRNQQQHQSILVNFGQLLYWETEISTGNIDSQAVLWVLGSAFLIFPASGAEGAAQHPAASKAHPELHLSLCSPNLSLEFCLDEFSVQGGESEFSSLSHRWLP